MYNIAVVGGGIIGVTTALEIQKDVKNCRIVIFADKLTPETTGDLSAGFWTPYLLEQNSDSDITKWSKVTHNKLHHLWKSGYASETGICLIPTLRLSTEENVEHPNWLKVPFGAFILPPEQLGKLSKRYNRKYTDAVQYVTFTVEPTKLLPVLMDIFLKNGGRIIKRKIDSFEQLSNFDLIVNCTGLQARQLTKDDDIHAIRGQISRVKAPWQFQVLSDESCDGCYIIPNTHYVILGGTHQENDENLSISSSDKEMILNGCAKMAPGLKTCTEHLDGVGLRPGRSKIRLEGEIVSLRNNKAIPVVHNYGHGGAGVTLSFGCAIDASNLVQEALRTSVFKSHL